MTLSRALRSLIVFFSDGDHYDKEILVLQVQLAKLAGCHVIGTCSTDAKGEFLKVSLLMFLLGPLFSRISVSVSVSI